MSGASVTVVVPTRNRRSLLELTLRSVLGQTGVELRVVVVDEGSSDDTPDFLSSLSDPRVSVLRHDEPKGLSAARNAGLAAAQTEWVAFVDDDDLWAPDKLAAQLAALRAQPSCQWSCVSVVQVDDHLRPLGAERLRTGDDVLRRLLAANAVPAGGSTVLIRTALLRELGGFRTDLRAAEDWECWIRLAQRSTPAVVDRPLVAYRVWRQSTSLDLPRMEAAQRRVRELHGVPVTTRGTPLDIEPSERYAALLELRAGRGRKAARRLAALALRTRRPAYLAGALAILASPKLAAAARKARWRATIDRGWLNEAQSWLRLLRDHGKGTRSPDFACLAWTHAIGYDDIVRRLGGDAHVFAHGVPRSSPAPIRYAVAAPRMAWYLARRRPSVIVVTNPPIFAPLIAGACALLTGSRLVLDSHPGSFGLRERRWRVFVPLHRLLVRRATATLVTSPRLAGVVESWGGRALVMHEAPPDWSVAPPQPPGDPPNVLFVTTFAPDEPVAEIIKAARLLPHVQARITGRTDRAEARLLSQAPENLSFTGWLAGDDYRQTLEGADVVVCLTTDEQSVMRGATEAAYAQRVLVHSDYSVGRCYFPGAVFCDNEAASIARAITEALAHHDVLREALPNEARRQSERWAAQLHELLALVGGSPQPTDTSNSTGYHGERSDELG